MTKQIKSTVLLVLCLFLIANAFADEQAEEKFLPIGLTEEEKLRLHEIGINHKSTRAPLGEVRNCAEWEPSEGVIIRWPLGISYSLVAEMSEDVMVTTIVGSSSQESTARSYYSSNGVNMSNTQFIIESTNSIWTRDYGPWFIFEDDQMAIVDHIYNRPRPLDDVIPQAIGSEWGLTVHGMDLINTGGNHMSDGLGRSFSTELVYDENPSLTTNEVDSIMKTYLGNDYIVLDYIESGGIHHIDCWAKLLNPGTILIKDVPASSPSHSLLNARADYLSQMISPWGRPYEVIRVYCPYGTAYINSLILNDKVLVPIFGSSYDDDAIQTYQEAMPGYEIIGFTGSWLDDDAIHCRTMGVPDREMLYIRHVPLPEKVSSVDPIEVGAYVKAHSGADLIEAFLEVNYSIDDGSYTGSPLSVIGATDSVTGTIPAQAAGSSIKYIIKAADESGRMETHPYIGTAWAHETMVNNPPTIDCVDTLIGTADSYLEFCPNIIDSDDLDHTISYRDIPTWLAMSNDSLKGWHPAINALDSVNIACNDGYDIAYKKLMILTYLCGDLNDDNDVNLIDILMLISYIYDSEPVTEPQPLSSADVNSDSEVNLLDILHLIDFIYGDPSGPEPECP